MKTVSKALIAVMVAAAMCAPLFAIEDVDAFEIKPGESALSFEASDVPIDKFNELLRSDYVEDLIHTATGYVPISEAPSVTKVNNLKVAIGIKVTDATVVGLTSQSTKLEIVIEGDLVSDYALFDTYDGYQGLFKYLGNSNTIASGTHLKIEGTIEVSDAMVSTSDIFKTDAGKIGFTMSGYDISKKTVIDLKYTFKVAGEDKIVNLKGTSIRADKLTTSMDYEIDDRAKIVDETKMYVTDTYDFRVETDQQFTFDGKTASYQKKEVVNDTVMFSYRDAKDYLGNYDEEATPMHYYYNTDPTLYGPDEVPSTSTSIQSDAGMKSFLEGIGTISDSYPNAESATESASATVYMGSSSPGGNNVIFYVIIGVLAVAIVALAVIMIKKR